MNEIYGIFEKIIFEGFGIMSGAAADLFVLLSWFLAFSVLAFYLMNPRQISASQPLGLLFVMLVTGFLTHNFQWMSEKFVEGMWTLGLDLSNNPISMTDFKDFDGMLVQGVKMAGPLLDSIASAGWVTTFWKSYNTVIPTLILAGILIGVNAYLAFRLFRSMLLYGILSMIAMLVMVTAIWNKTAWMAEGAIRYTVAMGLGILALGFVSSMLFGVAEYVVIDPDAPLASLMKSTASVVVGILLATGAQSMVMSYLSGSPDLKSGIGGSLRSTMYTISNVRTLASLRAMNAARQAALPPRSPGATQTPGIGSHASGSGGLFRNVMNRAGRRA